MGGKGQGPARISDKEGDFLSQFNPFSHKNL